MAQPTATPLRFRALRDELREARREYRAIARRKVSDDAPLPEQHRWWRMRDSAKDRYAMLDWQYQKTLLTWSIAALAIAVGLTALGPTFVMLMGAVTVVVAHRILVIFTRMAPGEDD